MCNSDGTCYVFRLKGFTKPELMSGDNQINCEAAGCKLDALKGLRFVDLPSTLVLQLKRFDLDMDAVM